MRDPVRQIVRAVSSESQRRALRQRLRRLARLACPGHCRRITPVSERWGFDRGTPIDRHYIEQFLTEHRRDIRGRVLEVQTAGYIERLGAGVERRDVLDMDGSNARATIIADLAAADPIPDDQFDCFILTQTLQLVYDLRAALTHARRILRPGGVLLVTVPSITRVDREFEDIEYWRFTSASCTRLFGELFAPDQLTIRVYGNVLAAAAFLYGLAAEELLPAELAHHDEFFPVIVAIRAIKRGAARP